MFRTPQFDKLLDKATSNLNLDPDWPTILQICDLIRQGDVQPKIALVAIKKKITNPNPHIAYYGLLVLESCVKNCGLIIHDEIGTKQYMEQLKDIVKTTTHENLKKKILELIQAWAFAFRNSPKYTAVRDTVNIMKTEGYEFPAFKESDAMFSADTAPEWADGDVCHRCRVPFGYVQRKHHCRACGQVFCSQCSNKKSMLPKFGIEKEVRVCEACFDQVNSRPSTASAKETDLPVEYLSSSLAQQQQVPTRKTAEEVQEEEELALALALSQSEAEEKEKQKKRMTNAYKANSSTITRTTYSPPSSPVPSPLKLKDQQQQDDTVDPELARYMNRKYWEQREAAASIIEEQASSRIDVTSPSAPNIGSPMPQRIIIGKSQNDELDNMDEFVGHLRSQVEIFVNRMKSNSSRGRSITNDSFFQNLFMSISTMHSKLLKHIREHDDTRVMYEGLQDKLAQVKDARAALDALREEHRDRLRREAEEAERLKQMQMAQKLDIMRKKKQEYLQYQRELALQKIQERERELQMRQEQQKQQYIMGSYQPIGNYMVPPNSQGSPIRQLHYQQPGNFNPISPTTNQGLYAYGPGPIGNYPMQNYAMPQMNSMPPHMMPGGGGGGMVNPQEQQSGQLPGTETMGGGQQQQQQQGIIPQMQNTQNIPPMGQMGGPGHQIGMANVSQVPPGHINAPPPTGPPQLPQGNLQSGPGQMGSTVNIQHAQVMPPGPQGMPPGPQGMPPGPQGMPPGPQGMPLGPQGIPTGPPQTMPPGPQMPQHIKPPNNPPTIGNIGPMSMNPGHQTIVQGQIPIPGQQIQQTIPFQATTTVETMQPPHNIKTSADDTAELISFD